MIICILGYYNRQNLGDDLFQMILSQWMQNHKCIFINPDDVLKLPSCDIILIGGGDLVNDYFMLKISTLLHPSVPVYGIGLGFPFLDLITKDYLKAFDFIITRTKSALPILTSLKIPTIFADDIVLSLSGKTRINKNKPRPIGIFLSSFMGDKIIDKIVNVLSKIAEIRYPQFKMTSLYKLYLYSMSTCDSIESDMIFNNKIYNRLKQYDNVYFIKTPIKPENAIDLFSNFYATICNRFHAHILSLCVQCPFVSLYSCFKVKDLLIAKGLEKYGQELIVDESTLAPIDFDENAFFNKWNAALETRERSDLANDFIKPVIDIKPIINNLIFYKPKKSFIMPDIKYLTNCQDIAEAITFQISRTREQPYTWGLAQNLEKAGFLSNMESDSIINDNVKWILENMKLEIPEMFSKVPLEKRHFNLRFVNQNILSGIHRSGWQFVVDNLISYHNPNGIIFDCFLDKTFGWDKDFLKKIGILPFKQEWSGIFHHTPNIEYDKNNLSEIVDCELFLTSLKYCKKIFVLSTYLKEWFTDKLAHCHVEIVMLYHPSETPDKKWSLQKWQDNENKKIIHVGAWMRNIYSFYKLSAPFKKIAIRGKRMENYFPDINILKQMCHVIDCNTNQLCRHRANKFFCCLYTQIEQDLKSVEIIDFLENDEYDKILTENIVFINLIDCSACNTIIECILRNTPIIVNRLPATEEYLGKKYPLFYSNLDEVSQLFDIKKIENAYKYLLKMDKKFLNIDTFLSGLVSEF